MFHMVNWDIVHKLGGGITPKDAHSIYMYNDLVKVNDAFVTVKGVKGLQLPIHMYDMKLIPLYL